MFFFIFSKEIICSSDYLKDSVHMIDRVLDIPVSVVLLGDTPRLNDLMQSPLTDKWFSELGHIKDHIRLNKSDWFYSKPHRELSDFKYNFTFSHFKLPEDVHETFVKAVKALTRPNPSINNSNIIHPYPMDILLQSLVDHYKIPSYTFFVLDFKDIDINFCESLHRLEPMKNITGIGHEIKFEISQDTEWSTQIEELLENDDFMGGWKNSSIVNYHIHGISYLIGEAVKIDERLFPTCEKRMVGRNRLLWVDLSVARSPDEIPKTNRDILQEMKFISKNETYTLALMSSLIIDAAHNVLAPPTPSFETPLADEYEIDISEIAETPNGIDFGEFEEILDSYLLENCHSMYSYDFIPLSQMPYLALPLYAKAQQMYDDDQYVSIDASNFREILQINEIDHKSVMKAQKMTRQIAAYVIEFHTPKVFLIDGISSSMSLDYISMAIKRSMDESFDPRPLLRSTLVHLYGLTPAYKWHSLSILSLGSRHTQLNQISRDVAVRNSFLSEISRVHSKVDKYYTKVMRLINHSKELDIPINDSIIGQINNEVNQVTFTAQSIISYTNQFHFLLTKENIFQLRSARKGYTKALKKIINDIQEQICFVAPANVIYGEAPLIDKFDKFFVVISPVWMVLVLFSFALLIYARTRILKMY